MFGLVLERKGEISGGKPVKSEERSEVVSLARGGDWIVEYGFDKVCFYFCVLFEAFGSLSCWIGHDASVGVVTLRGMTVTASGRRVIAIIALLLSLTTASSESKF